MRRFLQLSMKKLKEILPKLQPIAVAIHIKCKHKTRPKRRERIENAMLRRGKGNFWVKLTSMSILLLPTRRLMLTACKIKKKSSQSLLKC